MLGLRRHTPWLAAGLAALALAAPAAASAAPGAVKAADDATFGSLFMDASQSDPQDHIVDVNPGEKVTFSYPAGTNVHNVVFEAAGPQPTNCVQVAGVTTPAPPIAGSGQPPGWSGECTFPVAGTYNFFCQIHPYMVGSVVAVAASNHPPTVTTDRTPAGDIPRNSTVAFTATGSDPDGDPLTYEWDFGDGLSSQVQNPNHLFDSPGAYAVKLTVRDDKGGVVTETLNVTVTQANRVPTVTASRIPAGDGNVTTPYAFSAVATDPDGDALTYAWDFGDGTTGTGASAAHTYATSGAYDAKVTASDGKGGTASATVLVTVYGTSCTPGVLRDDFNGNQLGAPWSVVRRDANITVDNGMVTLPTQAGDLYEATNTARNIILRPAPAGAFTITTKLNHKGTAQYQQGGIIVYGDDDNYIKLDRTSTNTASATTKTEFVEFVQESAAVARNAGADHTGNLPAAQGPDMWLRIVYDGTTLTGQYSADGTTWTPAGQASTAMPANARIGFFALSNAATTTVNAVFDWWQVEGPNAPQVPGCVSAPNANPVISSATRTPSGDVTTGAAISFAAAATDADGDALTYAWDFGDTTTSAQQNPAKTYTMPGTYAAKVTVTDGKGGTATRTVDVVVTGTALNPTVTAARTPTGNTRVGVPIAFTATGTDPDGDALTYSWSFGDGTAASTQQNPTHAFATAGTFTVTATVSDGKGATGTATLSVVVAANRNPTISMATVTGGDGVAPVTAQFTAAATDPDGHAVTYAWDLDGDGTFEATGQNVSFTYTTPKVYAPVLKVSDAFGGSATRTLAANVFATTLDPDARYHVLVFSKTAAFRHSAIPSALAAIRKLGAEHNFTVDATEDGSLFTDAFLSRYDLVVFNSTTGDVLTDPQQAAFERFIRAGNGYTGLHSATDTEYTWPWYGQLTGAYFRNHPNGTPTGTVVVEDATKVSTKDLPARWTRVDEWYNFQGIANPVVNGGGTDVSPRGSTPIHVLLKMDESTYTESDGTDGVDDDHPVAWCKRYDGGRMFYTALGHTEATYVDPAFLSHLLGGMDTAAGMVVDADCGVDPNTAPVLTASIAPTGTIGAGDTVAFSATATDADGDTLTYAWDFGDTATSAQASPTHAYNTPGTYTAKVTVSDGKGGTAAKTFSIVVETRQVSVQAPVGADVATVLALSLGGTASLGAITPGVAADYTASVTATVTSTAGDAALAVSDPDTASTGKLVSGTYTLEQPLQVRATDAANPSTGFAPVTGSAGPLALLSWSRATSLDPVTVTFKQSVGAGEALRAGTYGKTLTFTLSTTTP